MGKKIAIVQSNYIPWKGYFDMINQVDEFILFDDVQYTKRDWRNRNLIKTQNGLKWLTIPVYIKGKRYQKIYEASIADENWKYNHWKIIVQNYSKARYFNDYKEFFEELFCSTNEIYLSLINYRFLKAICDLLGIKTKISWSMDYQKTEGKTEKLIYLCQQAKATELLAGPRAKNYIDENLFQEAGIELTYMDYSGYPVYTQLYPPFVHEVSIIDLILNEGPESHKYLKSFK